jgi:hypothetical protein
MNTSQRFGQNPALIGWTCPERNRTCASRPVIPLKSDSRLPSSTIPESRCCSLSHIHRFAKVLATLRIAALRVEKEQSLYDGGYARTIDMVPAHHELNVQYEIFAQQGKKLTRTALKRQGDSL